MERGHLCPAGLQKRRLSRFALMRARMPALRTLANFNQTQEFGDEREAGQ